MSKQSIMDRVTAAKHSLAGQGLAKVVCKATTEEVMGPKKKHLDYLIQCTNEPNVSIPQLADLLIERTQQQSWVIVFKALITTHNLMNYGNERFTQYLASNNCSFNLGQFIDKQGVQGYDMSTFIRRYSKYLNEKAVSYRQMAFDFCKVKRGKDDGLLRTMNADKLLKTLPALQKQLDSLLEFDCAPNELTNGVINACFLLMFKDLIRLFACYNDGIINLLEKYFDMNKKQCKDALEIYKRFLVRMDKVSEFLKTAENASKNPQQSVGIDKSDIPDLAKGLKNNANSAPSSLLDALEQHYQSLEGKKGVTTPVSGSNLYIPAPVGFAAAINTISSNTPTINVSEEERQRILDEENARLQQLKEQRMKELGQSPQPNNPATNPFATQTPNGTSDLFGSPTKSAAPQKASDDLLSLSGNPFVQNVQNVMAMQNATQAMSQPNSFAQWNSAPATSVPASSSMFTSDVDFEKVFPNQSSNTSAAFPGPPMPTSPALHQRSLTPTMNESAPGRLSPALISSDQSGFDAFGEVLKPTSNVGMNSATQEKLINKDLDSSLSQLAGNLNIKGSASQVKKQQHDWQPKGEQKKTGGQSWQGLPPNISSSTWTSPSYGQPMVNSQSNMTTQSTMINSQQPPMMAPVMGYNVQPMMQQPGMMGVRPMGMQPAMGMQQPIGMQPAMGMQQPMVFGMQPAMGNMMSQPRPPAQTNQDPFGAL
ncbi:phosphatidylinositol-binding clathrin assembly protein LAP-like isoform X8 [Crassostrea angulata]|uniref:phosphatidylinositol-binding clathrin assembly protein LAP-like isoform X8 n=1 Tax=Magallana angulata TaxID=2784310 RepID=UPI0022B16CF1|nr:phosphatidylinositol-binding clathrin assembly protein LAP-like isoform X8 [Crassostrea angulata]